MDDPNANRRLTLAKLLVGIPVMRREDGRDAALRQLERDGYGIADQPATTDRIHCLGIIDAALEQRGTLKCLARILLFLDGSVAAEKFAEAVERLLPSDEFLSLSDRAQLIRDLSPYVSGSELGSYYRAVTSELAQRAFVDLEDLISELEQLLPHGQCNPLIMLTEAVAQHATLARAADIAGQWSERLAADIDSRTRGMASDREQRNLTELRKRGAGISVADSGRPALVLQLEPSGPRRDRYLLSAWLYLGNSFVDKICGGDNPVALNELRAVILDALNRALIRVEQIDKNSTEIMLEFIIPRQLMCYPFEHWSNDAANYRSLAVQFVVVVRDLDRQRDPALRLAWRRKWLHMRLLDNASNAGISRWITCADEPCNADQLYRQLLPDEWVSLGLTFPPKPGGHRFELAAMLDAGTPVAVWPRRCEHAGGEAIGTGLGERFKESLCQRLGGRRLEDLPRLVLELRMQQTRADDPGSGVTLLWDDPTRCPEPDDFSLDAPAHWEGNS